MRTTRGALALLAGIAACLGAVAYAAAPHEPARPGPDRERAAASLPRPSIPVHPNRLATSTSATFGFTARGRDPHFSCKLDERGWSVCQSPVAFKKVAVGSHSFSVRSIGRNGRHSQPARFRWRVLEAKDFSIVPQLSGLSALYPGSLPLGLPLRIENPNPVPILITSLQVTTTADPQGCMSAQNLVLTQSNASSAMPLKIKAGGSASVPSAGVSAPTIQLRELAVNQDACQNAQFPLAFSGKARG